MRISDWSSDVCSSDLPSVSTLYAGRLAQEGVVDQTMIDEMVEHFVKHLDEEFEAGKAYLPNKADWFEGRWAGLGKPADPETARRAADTGVAEDRLRQVGRVLTTVDRKSVGEGQ